MQDHRPAILAASLGFVLTLAVQLPPILDERAKIAAERAELLTDTGEERVELDAGTTSRFSQLIASGGVGES